MLTTAGVAFAGDSAAVPGLGAATWTPPWDAGLSPGPWPVTLALALACLLGAATVVLGLAAVRAGAGLAPRRIVVLTLAGTALLVCVPPLGSADHLSYAAYGRIAAAGDDPYTEIPISWRDGTDPVAGAVQPPWQRTPSVYGPVATAVQAATAVAGHGSLRLTVWAWQLVAGAAFLLVGRLLHRLLRHDPAARTRAAVLWTLNPLLLGQLVLGAHLDGLAAAAALTGLALSGHPGRGRLAVAAGRWAGPVQWTAGGAALGVAAGVKAPYALTGLAVCWGLRRATEPWLRAGYGLAGALAVLVPAHLWTGGHTYDQVGQATRFVSFATPWRLLVDHTDLRPVVRWSALLLFGLLTALLARRVRPRPEASGDPVVASGAAAAAVLGGAWVLSVPYALPWYDAMVWSVLPLVVASGLDAALLARLAVLVLAYLPGRVSGLGAEVERVTLGFRREVAPWLVLAALIAVVWWTTSARRRSRPSAGRRRPAPAPGS